MVTTKKTLIKLGVPEGAIPTAIRCVQQYVSADHVKTRAQIKSLIQQLVAKPELFLGDERLADFAKAVIDCGIEQVGKPICYRTWGSDIDPAAHQQMENACHVPQAVGGALMPDAHLGYGLPIGGVLACEGAVIPYAVGVDIACRMKLSVLDLPIDTMTHGFDRLCESLERGTRFGVGVAYRRPQQHQVMDQDWTVSRTTRENRDKAWRQLGTSGSGNHFVEFGVLSVSEVQPDWDLAAGSYLALLSHSGSRGPGASVCSTYSKLARDRLPKKYASLGRLAWLDLSSQEGQEYWLSMNLMGDYASANHAVIHQNVTQLLGARTIAGVENHHNFAWLERHQGRDVVVHRKGATPAAKGMLGVIPGSMADPAFVVRGKGVDESYHSASHGAGRCMSRKAAKAKFNFTQVRRQLKQRDIHVLSAGADEVPGVYKDILSVMADQQDLVEPIARFDPKIVKMCGDGSRPED